MVPFCYTQCQNTPPSYTEFDDVHLNATNYTISNLIPKTLCEVSVSAVYNESLDETSVPVSASAYMHKGLHLSASGPNVTQCFHETDVIEGLDVGVINNSAVALFWIPIVPQCCISYYVILCRPVNDNANMNGTEVLTTHTMHVFAGLTSGEEYHFTVFGVLINGNATSPLSENKSIATVEPPQATCSTAPISPTFSYLLMSLAVLGLLLVLAVAIILILVIVLCTKRRTSRTKKRKSVKK